MRLKFNRLVVALVSLALLVPASASAESFDPSQEFKLKDWVPIHIGGLDLSINRAVVYLLVGSALTCLLGICLMRWRLSFTPGILAHRRPRRSPYARRAAPMGPPFGELTDVVRRQTLRTLLACILPFWP